MYLSSLELQGFKSFPDKIKIEFGRGMTGIVGPNGSGKSNISDAIRWVLGEQSSKLLRGSRMEDVIFGGTEKRNPLGFAEVSLTLDNTAQKMPLESSHISITRRFYRSGESEYMINKKNVRLKDVRELFMDTGLGRDGYSIISQGKIDDILSQKSEDRREVFEEAAGITKFRTRKEEAEKKLESSAENITRLNDIINEIELQLAPLGQKAEKARAYLLIHDEQRELELGLWSIRLAELKSELNKISGGEKITDTLLVETREKLEKSYKDIENLQEMLQVLEVKTERARIALRENESALAKEVASEELSEERITSRKERAKRLYEELQLHDRKDEDQKQKIAQWELERDEISKTVEQITKELGALMERAESEAGAMGDLDRRIDALAALENVLASELSENKSTLAAAQSQSQELELNKEHLRETLKIEETKLENQNQLSSQHEKDIHAAKEKVDAAANVVAGYELMSKTRNEKLRKTTEERTSVLSEQNALNSRLTMLRDLEREYEGYSRSVKAVMQFSKQGGLPGIIGTIGSLVSVEREYTLAVETALGSALQNIAVENEEAARDAIEMLKQRDLGRATFLPTTSIKGSKLSEQGIEQERGFVGIASDLCTYDGKLEGIFYQLLGRTVVASRLDDAIAMSRKYRQRFRIVTLDGQIINAGGAITGGSLARNAGILSRANEIKRCEKELSKLGEKRKTIDAAAAEADRLHSEARYNLDGANQEMRQAQDELLALNAAKGQHDVMKQSIEARIEQTKAEMAQALERLQKLTENARDLAASSDDKEAKREQIIKELSSIKEGRAEAAQGQAGLSEAINEQRVKLAAQSQALENAESTVRRAMEQLSDDDDLKAMARDELAAIESEIETETLGKSETTKKIATYRTAISVNEANISALISERNELETERTAQNTGIKNLNESVLNLEREMHRYTAKKENAQSETKQICDRMWENYEMTPGQAEQNIKPPENRTAAQKRANELKAQKRSLGAVDLDSIEEFKKVTERYEYLTAQRKDIELSSNDLKELIGEITTEMEEIFIKAFREISESFMKTFAEIFGGGTAELRFEDPTDVLSSGIEIKVSPPGKSLKYISLLSGGEKALSAIALYFAILKVQPSPFCVLDEIDAALDEQNVVRFSNYVKKLADDTQFILMTHRRGTMEAADMLYGVTMQEQGISKLVTLDLNELDKRLKRM